MTSVEQDRIRQIENHELGVEGKPHLTPQKIEILKLAARGKTYLGIAKELKVSFHTVKAHFSCRRKWHTHSGIFERLGVRSCTEAVIKAIKLGIIDMEEIEIDITKPEGIPEEKLPLTQLELKILILTGRGYTNLQMGKELNQSPQTVKNHFSNRLKVSGSSGIFEKLGAPSSRTAAVVRALQLGLITLNEIYEDKQITSPSHERLHEHPGVGGW